MLVSISEGEALEGELAAILLMAADMFAIVELSRWVEGTAIVKSGIWAMCERRAVTSESVSASAELASTALAEQDSWELSLDYSNCNHPIISYKSPIFNGFITQKSELTITISVAAYSGIDISIIALCW
jgi:hypothetical protein